MRRPLRVGYVLRAFPRLSETFILGEILALIERGVDVRIYALEHIAEPIRHPAAAALLPHVEWIPKVYARTALRLRDGRGGWPDGAGRWLAQRLRREGVQHLHAHFAGPAAAVAAAAAERTGTPFTFTAHAKDIFARKVNWSFVGRMARSARAVITVCEYNRRYLRRRLASGVRVVRLYNGVDLERWRPRRTPTEARTVLAVGRLVPKKGFEVLIEASARLARRGVKFRVDIVGDGAQRDTLGNRIRVHGLSRHVRLLSARPEADVRRRMRAAGLVALPCVTAADGNQDALPTVLLEAGACGIPAVSTWTGGVPEIIAHGRTGVLVPPGDAAALARAIERLLDRPARRCRMGRAARAHIAGRFDRRDSIRRLLDLFDPPATPYAGRTQVAHHAPVS